MSAPDIGTPGHAAALLCETWPDGIPAAHYSRAVSIVLQSIGWTPPLPKHHRVGALVAGLLAHGPMTYAMLEQATRLSTNSVARGLKACGAVVVREERKKIGRGRATRWYGLPGKAATP